MSEFFRAQSQPFLRLTNPFHSPGTQALVIPPHGSPAPRRPRLTPTSPEVSWDATLLIWIERPSGYCLASAPQVTSAHSALTPTGSPFPKPELISQLEQGEELWVLGLVGAEEPEALSSCRTGESMWELLRDEADWRGLLGSVSDTALCSCRHVRVL